MEEGVTAHTHMWLVPTVTTGAHQFLGVFHGPGQHYLFNSMERLLLSGPKDAQDDQDPPCCHPSTEASEGKKTASIPSAQVACPSMGHA